MASKRLSTWLALRCKEPAFQQFLHAHDEQEATTKVRELCRIGSRSELDRDADAAERCHTLIRKPYLDYLNS